MQALANSVVSRPPTPVSVTLDNSRLQLTDIERYSLISMSLEERRDILYAAQNDLDYRDKFNAACAGDACFFINTCLLIFEPRADDDNRILPFLLRPFQEKFLTEIKAAVDGILPDGSESLPHDVIVEKSREVGATWLMLAFMLHRWLFERNFTGKMGSITRDKVDKKGDYDTLFSKLDFMVDSLRIYTPWLYPAGYDPDPPYRTYMKMQNPINGSVLSGEPSGPEFGRSGRQKMMFLDEFATWPFGHASWTACSKSTDCRIAVSTPRGMGNLFGKLANPRADSEYRVPKITLSWEDDPSKNYWVEAPGQEEAPQERRLKVQPWLEAQKALFSYDPTMLAQEIFIDYGRSVRGQVYPQIVKARHGYYEYNPDLPLWSIWDFGVRDNCAIIWVQYNKYSRRFPVIDAFQFAGKSIRWYVPLISGGDYALGDNDGGYTEAQIAIIERHAGWQYSDHFGDPAGRQRNPVTATSVIHELSKHGVYIHSRTTKKNARFDSFWEETRTLTQKLCPLLDLDIRYTQDFEEAIVNSRYPEASESSEVTTIVNRPVHDEYSHFRTSLEYLALNVSHLLLGTQDDFPKEGITIPEIKGAVFGDIDKYRHYLQNKAYYDKIMGGQRRGRGNTGY